MFQVCFRYDESARKWAIIVEGASSALEAQQGFNAVMVSTDSVIIVPPTGLHPVKDLGDGTFEIEPVVTTYGAAQAQTVRHLEEQQAKVAQHVLAKGHEQEQA